MTGGPEHLTGKAKQGGLLMSRAKSKSPLSVTITTGLTFVTNFDNDTVRIDFDIKAVDEHEKSGKRKIVQEQSRQQALTLPMGLFKDEDQYKDWARRVYRSYHETVAETLIIESFSHLVLVSNFLLDHLKIQEIDLKRLIDEYARRRAQDTRRALKITVKGRHSLWTQVELERAVRQALKELPAHLRTQRAVADRLRKAHPEVAPKNGESLRKLMRSMGMNWSKLKTGK